MGILSVLWIWLAWGVLSANFTLLNILIVAMTWIIVFVPLWKKFHKK